MINYLIILLDDTSISYCHYDNPSKANRLMPLEVLKEGIFFAMKENWMIQFVFPDYELPNEYKHIINSIDHNIIVSNLCEDIALLETADVIVHHSWERLQNTYLNEDDCIVLRTKINDFFDNYQSLKAIFTKIKRINIVFTDVHLFSDKDIDNYMQILQDLSDCLEKIYKTGRTPQLNLITDRLMLSKMNNCGAGYTNLTLAPNGKFYVCPAFYYENKRDDVGNLKKGLDVKNKQLYKIEYAPICSHCDAYHCKRCVWLNRKTTYEINTPSHEQCVMAHLERNAGRYFQNNICGANALFEESETIQEINYIDPFDLKEKWK